MRLRELRQTLGLTQRQMAEQLGCQQVAYQRYETGERKPSIEMLKHMAQVFDVTVDYLVGCEHSETLALSKYEQELVAAARSADKRAQEDALSLLKAHGNAYHAEQE